MPIPPPDRDARTEPMTMPHHGAPVPPPGPDARTDFMAVPHHAASVPPVRDARTEIMAVPHHAASLPPPGRPRRSVATPVIVAVALAGVGVLGLCGVLGWFVLDARDAKDTLVVAVASASPGNSGPVAPEPAGTDDQALPPGAPAMDDSGPIRAPQRPGLSLPTLTDDRFRMPEVTGHTQDAAVAILSEAGLNVRVIEEESSLYQPGTVISQSFRAGSRRSIGETVTIRVAAERADPATDRDQDGDQAETPDPQPQVSDSPPGG